MTTTHSLDTPAPFEGLIEAGQQWAQQEVLAASRKDVHHELLDLFVTGALLWQAKRRQMKDIFENGGGIEKGNRASFCDGLKGKNYVKLKNGQLIYASQFLKAPILSLNSWDNITHTIEAPFKQSHDLQVAFGGKPLGGGTERPDSSIDELWFKDIHIDSIIYDDTFLPEEVGIIENVTTTHPVQLEGAAHTSHANKVHYALHGIVKETPIGSGQPMPDPYQDASDYRNWILDSTPQIDLSLRAPITEEGSGNLVTNTVINHNAFYQPNGEVAVASLQRFQSLLTYYATHQYPELFSQPSVS